MVGPLLDWLAALRLNTQMNPVLASFRSTTADRHWTVTLLAALDAVAMRLALGVSTTVPDDVEFVTEGAVTLGLLAHDRRPNWPVERRVLDALDPGGPASAGPVRGPVEHPRLTDAEWSAGWSTLVAAGVTTGRDGQGIDEQRTRQRFESIRSQYVAGAYAVARRHHAVRAPWSGPRTPDTPVVRPLSPAVVSVR